MKKRLMTTCPMSELALFLACLEHNFQLNSSEYPLISSIDINNFQDLITSFSNNGIGGGIGCDMLYDPIMEPLVQSWRTSFTFRRIVLI